MRASLKKKVLLYSLLLIAGGLAIVTIKINSHEASSQNQTSAKQVAITFDDGPKQGTTELLLDGLKERNVQATFFLIGMQIDDNKALIKRMCQEGHQIGNHTFNHKSLTELDNQGQKTQLLLCSEAIRQNTWSDTVCVRPPYGQLNEAIKGWINAPIILWSVDTMDWTGKSAEEICRYIVDTVQPGDIILLHDIYEESVEGALQAIDCLLSNGYSCVTVEQLFKNKGITLENGKVYRHARD